MKLRIRRRSRGPPYGCGEGEVRRVEAPEAIKVTLSVRPQPLGVSLAMAPEASNYLLLVLGTETYTKQENPIHPIHCIPNTISRFTLEYSLYLIEISH
jgi:hypothetical protein